MSPEVVYDQVEKQHIPTHPLRRGRAPVVSHYPTSNLSTKSLIEEELASVRKELGIIKHEESQELFGAGLAVQLFLAAAIPHASIIVALIQEIAISTLEQPNGEDIDSALLKGTIAHGVTAITGVG